MGALTLSQLAQVLLSIASCLIDAARYRRMQACHAKVNAGVPAGFTVAQARAKRSIWRAQLFGGTSTEVKDRRSSAYAVISRW
jgi:hypothetical protein